MFNRRRFLDFTARLLALGGPLADAPRLRAKPAGRIVSANWASNLSSMPRAHTPRLQLL